MQGQIQLTSLFGRYIFDICRRNDVKNIVEIGTWNGAGSTKCVYEAIKGTDKELISLEINAAMYNQAQQLYRGEDCIRLLLGKITDSFINPDDYGDEYFSDYPRSVKNNWLLEDKMNVEKVPNVLDQIPEQIDFLILDGGEFTSWGEYVLLKDRARIIAIDDTKIPCLKNVQSRHDLLAKRKILIDEQNERNGFGIYEKI